MTGALGPRLVLVTRDTEYDQLLARHATRGQTEAFLRRRSQTLEGLDAQRDQVRAAVTRIRADTPKDWRIAAVRRAELDRFLFGPEDVVVAVGQDGLVANVAKYLAGQPVIGVNGDPARNAGILVPHRPEQVGAMLTLAAAGKLASEERTMVRAELDDGQVLLALNEVFVGHASHQSARYTISHAGQEESQSSSGVIVATGTGATGWALSISRATGVTIDLRPEDQAAMFLAREPWPSRATGVSMGSGRIARGDILLLVSRMNEGGVVFADGIEGDRLDFAWGRSLKVSVADQRLRFVPGKAVPATSRTAPPATTKPVQASRPVARAAAKPATVNTPAPVRTPAVRVAKATRRVRAVRVVRLAALAILLLLALFSWLFGVPPASTPAPPDVVLPGPDHAPG